MFVLVYCSFKFKDLLKGNSFPACNCSYQNKRRSDCRDSELLELFIYSVSAHVCELYVLGVNIRLQFINVLVSCSHQLILIYHVMFEPKAFYA